MCRLPWLLLCVACDEARDSAGDSDTDTDVDTDTDSGETAPPDTGTPPEDARAVGIRWRLHETIGSIVYVTWNQVVPGTSWVEVDVDGAWEATPNTARKVGPAEQIVMGVPFDTAFDLRVLVDDGTATWSSSRREARTDAWPDGLPTPRIVASNPEAWEPGGRFLLGSINGREGGWVGGPYWMWILDRKGRMVWARQTPDRHWTLWATLARNGTDVLWDEFTYWSDWDGGASSKVHRWRLDGSEIAAYPTPGAHHAFVELPDDVLVWGAASPVSESLMERDAGGTVRPVWSCTDFYEAIDVIGACQSNALFWNEAADSFLYSFYTNDFVLEVDRATGEVVRQFGHLAGSWSFDPEDAAFWWQHGVSYTPEGTLLLSTHSAEGNDELAVREYALDDPARVLRQVWSFGVGLGVEARTNGEATRLPGGNTLHNYGSGGILKEVTPEGEVVWQVTFDSTRLLGHATWLENLYPLVP
ncbi:MAG: hypothetical protein JXB39_05480 [Deltaproteobacteria bacterium]|nr:hypothetical protein [Deltaproteobacteria bacterium]